MNRKYAGILLILMMLGHNYVINQPQSLQQDIQHIHSVTVTEFNLLYSIPSILAILSIIPVGIIYNSYPNFTLMFGVGILFAGQLLASMFGSEGLPYYFSIFVAGRTLEASGAQVLYMIQGNLASSWMGNFAGLVFILPEVGQIMNAFFTPLAAIQWGVKTALLIGVIFCAISVIACWYLYKELKRRQKLKSKRSSNIEMIDTISTKQNNTEFESKNQSINTNEKHEKQSLQDSKEYKSVQKLESNPTEHQSKQRTSDEQLRNDCKSKLEEPQSIFKAGKIFWLTILICAINECLYFPFLDNANEMIQIRFKIPYNQTGLYLCLPFLAAIITTLSMSRFLVCFQRKNLILYTSILPFLGHIMIMLLPNCEGEQLTIGGKLMLASGFLVFGTGIGGYYSVSFPAVGMSVPKNIRGLSYSVLCFFQTLAMSLVPILSGLIIEEDITNEVQGYRNSSFMFVILTLIGLFVGLLIKKMANENSYIYEDEDELVEEDVEQPSNDQIKLKHSSKQNKDYINIRVQRSTQQAR